MNHINDINDINDTTIDYRRGAATLLAATFTLSIVYEVYRATVKAGTSQHDSVSGLVAQLPLYAVAALVAGLLFARRRHAVSIGLAFCTVMIVIAIAYYNPAIMLERRPGLVDWIEDVVFTGLLFAAATQLINHTFRVRRRSAGVRSPAQSAELANGHRWPEPAAEPEHSLDSSVTRSRRRARHAAVRMR